MGFISDVNVIVSVFFCLFTIYFGQKYVTNFIIIIFLVDGWPGVCNLS